MFFLLLNAGSVAAACCMSWVIPGTCCRKKSELPIQCLLLLPCMEHGQILCSRVPAEVFCFSLVVFTPSRLPLPCPTVSPRWRVGAVQPLGDDDETPFLGKHSAFTASVVSMW